MPTKTKNSIRRNEIEPYDKKRANYADDDNTMPKRYIYKLNIFSDHKIMINGMKDGYGDECYGHSAQCKVDVFIFLLLI